MGRCGGAEVLWDGDRVMHHLVHSNHEEYGERDDQDRAEKDGEHRKGVRKCYDRDRGVVEKKGSILQKERGDVGGQDRRDGQRKCGG